MRLRAVFACGLTTLMVVVSSAVMPARGRVGAGALIDQDPAVVLADTVKVKVENNRVRVMEASIPPGYKEKMHSHPAYVIYVIEGGKVRNHAVDGTTSDGTFVTGDVVYREPLTHWAENIGTTTIHLILVELKAQ